MTKEEKALVCVASLFKAIQLAGGSVNEGVLKMTLSDFIFQIAGPNNIRFIYKHEGEEENG